MNINTNTMRKVSNLLSYGINHFGSGCYNSLEFNEFFELFKRSFNKELKCIGATDIEYSKGHFYLSGFFTVEGQAYYFSISDVRSSFGKPDSLLVRTAKDYKDYTGGANNYFKVEPGMSKIMANRWGFNYEKKSSSKGIKDWSEVAKKMIESGEEYFEFSIPSSKQAVNLMFRLMDCYTKEELDGQCYVSTTKYGRIIDSNKVDHVKPFQAYYYAQTKRFRIKFKRES